MQQGSERGGREEGSRSEVMTGVECWLILNFSFAALEAAKLSNFIRQEGYTHQGIGQHVYVCMYCMCMFLSTSMGRRTE